MNNNEIWKRKLINFFYNPPDKPLDMLGYENRRNEILKKVFGLEDIENQLSKEAVEVSAAMQRFLVPKNQDTIEGSHIDFSGDAIEPLLKHPITTSIIDDLDFLANIRSNPSQYYFKESLSEQELTQIHEILGQLDDWKEKFFYIWNNIFEIYPLGAILPADTRFPDHSIIDQCDLTSGLTASLANGEKDIGFFAFKLPDVQRFIASSRKFVDLWAGSHFVGLISFLAEITIIEEFGPDVIIFPYLRKNPLLNRYIGKNYLKNKGGFKSLEKSKGMDYVSIPNVFLAILPADLEKIESVKQKIKEDIENFLKHVVHSLEKTLRGFYLELPDGFTQKALNTTLNYFEPTSVFVKIPRDFEEFEKFEKDIPLDLKELLTKVKVLEEGEKLHHSINAGNFYNLIYIISQILISQKSRLFGDLSIKAEKKCNVCGDHEPLITYEDVEDIKSLKTQINPNETLCILCLIKRFYNRLLAVIPNERSYSWIGAQDIQRVPSLFEIANPDLDRIMGEIYHLVPEYKKQFKTLRYKNTELLSFETWDSESIKETLLDYDEIDEEFYNNITLRREEKYINTRKILKSLNKYYALLKIDGDHMGKLLSGDNLPNIQDIIHPAYLEQIKPFLTTNFGNIDEFKRPLTPSYHLTISKAMNHYALNVVPKIIEKYEGELIYSGGDDVFAILPAVNAVSAAKEINYSFSKRMYSTEKPYIFGLEGRTMSGGILYAHHKFPLSIAVKHLNSTEEEAKEHLGRSALMTRLITHGGQITSGGLKWGIEDRVERFISEFFPTEEELGGILVEYYISPVFLYNLYEILYVLPEGAYNNEIIRLLKRHFVLEPLSEKFPHEDDEEALKGEVVERTAESFMKIFSQFKKDSEKHNLWRDDFDEEFKKSEKFLQNLTNLFLILYKINTKAS